MYSRFVTNFSRVAASLNKRLKKGKPTQFELNDEERQMMVDEKQKLVNLPVLALRRPKEQFVIEKDAGDKQMGCVLFPE